MKQMRDFFKRAGTPQEWLADLAALVAIAVLTLTAILALHIFFGV